MRTRFHIFPLLLVMTGGLHGQGAGPSRLSPPPAATPPPRKELQDAAEKLREAKSNMDMEQAKEAAKGLVEKLPPGATEAARGLIQNPAAQGQALEAMKAVQPTLMPAAQKLFEGQGAESLRQSVTGFVQQLKSALCSRPS